MRTLRNFLIYKYFLRTSSNAIGKVRNRNEINIMLQEIKLISRSNSLDKHLHFRTSEELLYKS